MQYEKVTPFANQQIEIEYINEVQFVGEEEEFNLDMFNIFEEDDNNSVEDSLSVDNLVIEESLVENLVLKTTKNGFDYYGVELEEVSEEESEEDNSEELSSDSQDYEEVVFVEEPLHEEPVNLVEEELTPEDESVYGASNTVVSKEEDYSSVDDLLGSVDESSIVVARPTVTQSRPLVERPRKREISYHEGMSLRQFLRENPRSTMEVAEKYFTRREIMKEIQLGRVIKRGQKLFI